MNKNISVGSKLKQIACTVGLFGLMIGPASAQTFGQAADVPAAQLTPAPVTTPENYGDRGLPSITSARPDPRVQQLQQQWQQPQQLQGLVPVFQPGLKQHQ